MRKIQDVDAKQPFGSPNPGIREPKLGKGAPGMKVPTVQKPRKPSVSAPSYSKGGLVKPPKSKVISTKRA
jgi:hypothetical protein